MKEVVMMGFLSMIMVANFASYSLFGSPGNVFRSTENAAQLVELYSSEGCSSCPQADEWMSKLESAKGLWTRFVPVAYHVDYWDYLGWKDPIGSSQFSARQREYSKAWGRSNTYTPCVIVSGDEMRAWTHYSPSEKVVSTGILELREGKGGWTVTYEPTVAGTNWEVTVALLGSGIVSKVTGGENAGRTINHDFVVLNQARTTLTQKGKVFTAEVSLEKPQSPLSVPRWGIAAWVTPKGLLKPSQAVGGFLH